MKILHVFLLITVVFAVLAVEVADASDEDSDDNKENDTETVTYENETDDQPSKQDDEDKTSTSTTYDDTTETAPECTLQNESCGGDPNAYSNDCGNNNCGRRCSNYQKPIACPAVCISGCNCKRGYVFDDNIQKCVKPEKCTPVCKKDEAFNSCTNSGCVPQNCTQLGYPVPCVRLNPKYCKKGCVCAGDKLRAKNGTCVPKKQCDSPCGGDPNSETGCGVNCENRCSNRNNNETIPCLKICNINGCDCKKGYLLDELTNKCVLPNNCSVTCRKNERFSSCVYPNCGSDKCSDKGKIYDCPVQRTSDCVGKCVCKQGYLRNEWGDCVPEDECSVTCNGDPNAQPGCGVHCGNTCSTYKDKDKIACKAICKENGCDCKKGYVYDSNTKKCVKHDKCSPVCKSDEIYNSCINSGCSPQNCTELRFPVPCARLTEGSCIGGCVCQEGYLRNKLGKCVPKDKCDTFCGGDPNAIPGCGVYCGQRCSDRNNTEPVACPDVCNENGCACKEGYLYDDATGKCVLPRSCSVTCRKNERFSSCVYPNCGSDKCSDKEKIYHCPLQNTSDCVGKCVCNKGYLRNEWGDCIPEDTCPVTCNGDPNAQPGCGVHCGNTCSTYNLKYKIACKAICKENGCDCKKGYVYDSNTEKCVKPDQCSPVCKADEVYNSCMNSGCVLRNCTQLGTSVPCLRLKSGGCIGGCVCQEGYLRNNLGKCVLEEKCEKPCNGDPNAQPGCGVHCGNTCSTYKDKDKIACNTICNENGCDCKKGYVYDSNIKKCVKPDKCSPVCKPDETYNSCINSRCSPQNCTELGFPVPCALLTEGSCIGGCVCQEGYLRNKLGKCVPKEKCDTFCGGDPNAIPGCGVYCGQRCSDRNNTEPVACPDVCNVNGCECKKGYLYDDATGKCVLPRNCSVTCDKNEEFQSCVNPYCGSDSCDDKNHFKSCPAFNSSDCVAKCVCKEGFRRNKFDVCIPEDKCPKQKCGINEQLSTCINGICGSQSCADKGIEISCAAVVPSKCYPGCICKKGNLRDRNGTCIPEDTCPTSCNGDNNAIPGCGVNCGKQCSNYNSTEPVGCAAVCYDDGCDCKRGYVFDNVIKKCVKPEQCTLPKTCNGDPNSLPGCGNHCGKSCSTYNITELILCSQECFDNGCDCNPGYIFDDNIKKCVLPEQCTQICKSNEVYNKCINNGCEPRSCSDLGNAAPCLSFDEGSNCVGGCVCQDGYLRNSQGDCVPREECDTCGSDPNATPGCGGNCGTLCSNFNSSNPIICPLLCKDLNGCDCRTGYVFDEYIGKCVKPKQCSKESICGKNEVFSPCISGECRPEYCSEKDRVLECALVNKDDCVKGCVCKVGHFRNRHGVCIPANECPTSCKGDPNALPGCGVNCGRHCNKNKRICPRICYPDGCDCKEGYVYDDVSKKCVEPNQCSNITIPICGSNEEYSKCTNGICRAQNCTQKGQPIACPDLMEGSCEEGCVCKEYFLKAKNGTCVPESQCDVCPEGETYVNCSSTPCDAEYCPKSRNDPSTCTSNKKCGPPRCICGFNSRRDRDTGQCIRTSDCPLFPCNGPNEHYDSCPPVCPSQNCPNNSNYFTCPKFGVIGIVVPCQPQCRCNKGYYRNEKGICVSKEECASSCGKNEKYSECTNGECKPEYCSQKDSNIPCPVVNSSDCNKGCICQEGYYRNRNGECIPESECPTSCNGDPNALPGCGVNCGRLCSNYKKPNVACILICYPDGCDCKKGYVFDEVTKKCVEPSKCTVKPPLVCGTNEEYSSCANVQCRAQNCTQRRQPIPCPRIPIGFCKEGCVCKQNYLRGKNGTCVPKNECDVCPEGENYSTCPPTPCAEYCPKSRNTSYKSTEQCGKPRCICGFNRHRDRKTRNCIATTSCPPFPCDGPNEFYDSCPPVCPGQKCSDYLNNSTCPRFRIGIVVPCKPQCRCDKGFYRNDEGICIAKDECVTSCGKNEKYSECTNGECKPEYCSEKDSNLPCPEVHTSDCIKGCICEEGYYRNRNGECIPESECPTSCKGDPNALPGCGVNCGRLCSNYLKKNVACPLICQLDGCDCKQGYVFDNAVKKCVKPSECIPFPCDGPNEFFDSCPPGCPGENCLDYLNNSTCPKYKIGVVVPCKPQCRCEKGFYRDDAGICIKKEKCGKQCKINEVYSECTNGGCDARNCSQLGSDVPCKKLDAASCIKGCVCAKGYLRNEDGLCVPTEKCPKPIVCGSNEIVSSCINGGCERRNCSQLKNPQVCIDLIKGACKRGCICKPGMLRNSNGTCILEKLCPENQCKKPNEFYDFCPLFGDPQTCETIGKSKPSKPYEAVSICYPKCRCKPDFYRNVNGQCVSKQDCLKCTGPNEFYACGGACDNVCATLKIQNRTKCPIINIKCNEKCYCRDGYARNDKNICVPIKDCEVPKTCGDNEEFSNCVNGGCDKRNCTQVNRPNLCIDPITCTKGCVCKPGFLRDSSGQCISQEQCPDSKCKRVNEVFDTCPPIEDPQTCASIDKPIPKYTQKDSVCVGKCRCRQGYFRNSIGECISKADCLKCTGPHEYYSCGGACDNVCATPKEQSQKNCSIINVKCNEMCYCENGYARDWNNTCIPIKDCKTCPEGEVYSTCPPAACDADFCPLTSDAPSACISTKECKPPRCVCLKNYKRDRKSNKCIPIEDCPKCTGPNEFYACGGACDNVCATLKIQNRTKCPIINIKCNDKCYCKDGYARNDKNICVPIKDCEVPKTCGHNEEFSNCVNGGCDKRNCTQMNHPKICIDPITCIKGCVCKPGFLRNSSGQCISQEQCPDSKCKRVNEVFDTCPPIGDPQTCASIDKPIPTYTQKDSVCVGKCRCRQGYFRNLIGECISKADCLKCTGPHEYFSCGGACDNVCATLKEQSQKNCSIINVKCNEKCYCENEYARDCNNTCIPIKDCKTCPEGEVYSTCPPAACDADYCPLTPGAPSACTSTKECKPPRCVCPKNYKRDRETNKCIPIEDCPQFKCTGKHEVYDCCPSKCPGRSCNDYVKSSSCTQNEDAPCKPDCRCKKHYYKNSDGECVHKDKC